MRVQTMFLPAPADEYPFVLILDQCDGETFDDEAIDRFKADTGCKSVIFTDGTVEVL